MKSLKSLLLSGVLAAGFTSAHADTTVYIVGSASYRANIYSALLHQYTSVQYGYSDATSLGASTYALFQGTFPGVSGVTTVKTHFTGAVGGIQAVEQPLSQAFLANPGGSGGTAISASGTGNQSSTTDNSVPQITFSEVFQASTPFTANTLTDNVIAVSPYVFVASNGAHGITNITNQLAQYLWPSGKIPLSLFSGLNADEGPSSEIPVYATGRDPDAGNRVNVFAETGVGIYRKIKQYKPTASGTAIGSVALYPASTVNGIPYPVGQGGESSGSTAAKNLRLSGSDSKGYLVSYLPTNDARATALAASGDSGPQYAGLGIGAGPAVQLTYNGFGLQFKAPGTSGAVTPDGVAVITNPNVIEEGQYTLWGYEHLDYLPSIAADPLTVANALIGQISRSGVASGTTADAIIPLTSMNVQRAVDGGLVTSLVY